MCLQNIDIRNARIREVADSNNFANTIRVKATLCQLEDAEDALVSRVALIIIERFDDFTRINQEL